MADNFIADRNEKNEMAQAIPKYPLIPTKPLLGSLDRNLAWLSPIF